VNTRDTASRSADEIDLPRRLSTLWVVVMFNMAFADILTLIKPGALQDLWPDRDDPRTTVWRAHDACPSGQVEDRPPCQLQVSPLGRRDRGSLRLA
jgi:hypothetical protein